MTDIVERLREEAEKRKNDVPAIDLLMEEAADTIEDVRSFNAKQSERIGALKHDEDLQREEIVRLRTELAKRDAEIEKLKGAPEERPHIDIIMDANVRAKPIVEHVTPDGVLADTVAAAIHEGRMSAASKYGILPGDDLEAIKRKIRGRQH